MIRKVHAVNIFTSSAGPTYMI